MALTNKPGSQSPVISSISSETEMFFREISVFNLGDSVSRITDNSCITYPSKVEIYILKLFIPSSKSKLTVVNPSNVCSCC